MSNSSASLSEARDIDAELVSASRAGFVVAKFATSLFLALAFSVVGKSIGDEIVCAVP